jgi:hypothetical protein
MEWNTYLTKQFKEYAKMYFRGRLPKRVKVSWGVATGSKKDRFTLDGVTERYPSTWGDDVHEFYITIDWGLRHFDALMCIVLLHEMAHVATWNGEKVDHGPKWKAEISRLIKAGAYDKLF